MIIVVNNIPFWWLIWVFSSLNIQDAYLLLHFSEDGEEIQDTDSDVAEQRECGRLKVKWTPEEVSYTAPFNFISSQKTFFFFSSSEQYCLKF